MGGNHDRGAGSNLRTPVCIRGREFCVFDYSRWTTDRPASRFVVSGDFAPAGNSWHNLVCRRGGCRLPLRDIALLTSGTADVVIKPPAKQSTRFLAAFLFVYGGMIVLRVERDGVALAVSGLLAIAAGAFLWLEK